MCLPRRREVITASTWVWPDFERRVRLLYSQSRGALAAGSMAVPALDAGHYYWGAGSRQPPCVWIPLALTESSAGLKRRGAVSRQVIDLHKDFKTEGADMGNILGLRDVTDADKIVDAMAKCKKAGGKVLIRTVARRQCLRSVHACAMPLHGNHLAHTRAI